MISGGSNGIAWKTFLFLMSQRFLMEQTEIVCQGIPNRFGVEFLEFDLIQSSEFWLKKFGGGEERAIIV